jgi:opacity protein-like surface antigen
MRKFMWVIILMVVAVLPARAQTTPQVEMMGGYSYLRADMGGADTSLHGWDFSFAENINSWLGGKADFGGFYGSPGSTRVNTHTFMFGPQFSYRKSSTITPFAHVLIGGMRASRGYLGISEAKTDFAAAFGGGLDLKVHDNVAIRVIQAEYVVTPYLDLRQDNVRVSAGIVLRFGKR